MKRFHGRRARTATVTLVMVALATFAVAAPVAASGNTGGGNVEGFINFDSSHPVPATLNTNPVGLGPCPYVDWSWQDLVIASSGSNAVQASTAVIANLALVWYDGPMGLTVRGHSGAECVYLPSFGTIDTWGANGYNPATTGYFGCTGNPLPNGSQGQYLRIGPAVLVQVSGNCQVNGLTTGTINFTAIGDLQPTVGDGLADPIYRAAFSGAWEGLT